MTIIDLDGPSAVGKTTLIRTLCQSLPHALPVNELLAGTSNPYAHWRTPEDFLQKQLWFFTHTARRYAAFPEDSTVSGIQLNDIGLVDVICHTCVFPLANRLSWNVFPQFQTLLLCGFPDLKLSNLIFYLHASEKSLRRRKESDTSRVRGAFESNLRLLPHQEQFYRCLARQLPEQVFYVDAESTPCDLAEQVTRTILVRENAPSIPLYGLLAAAEAFLSSQPAPRSL